MDNGEPQEDTNEAELSQEQTENLLHFQQITNNDDLEQCKRIMRAHHWNVELVVHSTLPGFTEAPQSSAPPAIPSSSSSSVQGLRHRNVGLQPHMHSLLNTRFYEARSSTSLVRPQGAIGWGYYLLSGPFRWAWITFSGIVKFFIRLFITEPRMAIVNPLGDVQDFIKEYEESFGSSHPKFVQGTYSDAQNEARRSLRFLLVYLHDPDHRDTESFCRNTLSNTDVIELIDRNFVFWACSTRKPEGYRVSKSMRENTHPFLAVICSIRGKLTIVGRLEGPLTSQEFMEQASALIDHFEPALEAARADKADRDMTQILRNEQDAAYEQSLQEDKEKEENRKKDEEMKLIKERELAEKNRMKAEEEERHLTRKKSCKEMLLEEPESNHPDAMKLLIKLPDGSRLTRNFLSTQPIKVIHDYIYCQETAPRRFQVTTNFPRRVIPGCSTTEILATEADMPTKSDGPSMSQEIDKSNRCHDCDLSIAQSGLKNSEMIFVQAIDDSDDEES